jgi:hypothetical protein
VSEGVRAAAEAVGAADVFVLRRVTARRFVHFGGSGRGNGWAGLVEVSLDDEAPLAEALRTVRPVRIGDASGTLVFGPYYARGAAIVPVVPDIVVVFGAGDGAVDAPDDVLFAAARATVAAVSPPGRARELADELELLEAVRAAAVTMPPGTVPEAMRELASIAVDALSCEIGIVYLAKGDRISVVERGWSLVCPGDELASALASVLTSGEEFPYCVQDATTAPLPGPLAAESGIRSYYLLELTGLARGVLLVAHTDAAPRGFTLLCRRLGVRLAEVGSASLGVGLTREWVSAEAARLQTAFAELES